MRLIDFYIDRFDLRPFNPLKAQNTNSHFLGHHVYLIYDNDVPSFQEPKCMEFNFTLN